MKKTNDGLALISSSGSNAGLEHLRHGQEETRGRVHVGFRTNAEEMEIIPREVARAVWWGE